MLVHRNAYVKSLYLLYEGNKCEKDLSIDKGLQQQQRCASHLRRTSRWAPLQASGIEPTQASGAHTVQYKLEGISANGANLYIKNIYSKLCIKMKKNYNQHVSLNKIAQSIIKIKT